MGRIEIRLALESDLEAVLDLFELVAEERLWIGTEPGFDRAQKRARFQTAIRAADRTPMWVAYDEATLAGHLSIFEHVEAGLALGMMVHPAYRRRGIGRSLMECSFAWGRKRGVPSLALHVFPHNGAARALYRGAGFVEIERYERDVTRRTGDVWDTILMRKQL